MVAVATVLSVLKIAELPYGGSITLAAMLPIVIISYRHGLGWGLGAGFTYGVLQQLLGLKNLTYFTSAGSIIAIILLDYLVAFTVMGLGGMFRRVVKEQNLSVALGTLVCCVLRYACHVISGATVWAGLSIPDSAALAYSFAYNATYMIPETIVTVLAAYYLCSLIDLRTDLPTRLVRTQNTQGTPAVLGVSAGLVILGGLIYDVAAVFSKLQSGDSGLFDITGLNNKWLWISVAVVTFVVAAVATSLILVRRKLIEDGNADKTEA
jgi:thiamine transporter